MMSFRNYAPAVVAFCLLLGGCGGGSSTPSTTSDGNPGTGDSVLTGVFVDSAVEGVSFATETQSGTTNAAGEFSYLAGEQVTFSIGSAQLPAVAAAAQITPVDIAASSATPAAMTTNIARLLQSLDQDGNPDNGITISADAAVSAPQLNFDVSITEFENNAEVINLVANSGSVTMTLISADDANSHLNNTLGITSATSNDGLWIRNAASETGSGMPDYSFVDGLNITRYNSAISGDDSACYTLSFNTATPLGDNRFQLNADNGPIFYTAVRVADTLEVTFDGEPTLIYPRATGIDRSTLPLCDGNSDTGTTNETSAQPMITGHTLSTDNLSLTVTFSVDMTEEYKTEGEYLPSRTFWQDPRTFVVEFQSVQPGGSIRLIPEFFIAISGETLAEMLEVVFDN